MTGWRWNPRIAAVTTAVFLLIQLALPVTRLVEGGDRSQRLGWQMFTHSTAFEFTVVTATDETVFPLEIVLARPRGDMALEELVPPHLCATVEGAVRVTWEEGVFEC